MTISEPGPDYTGVIATIQAHDSEKRFCGLGAKAESGSPEFIDEYSLSLNQNTVSAKK